jgi:coenzyme PQQ synthesis protein D (PqqD)
VKWRRSPQALWRTAPGYLALSTVDGRTVEVGGPGGDIWVLLAEWITDDDLTAALARAYGAEVQVVSPDVRSLLHQLHAQGYIDRSA